MSLEKPDPSDQRGIAPKARISAVPALLLAVVLALLGALVAALYPSRPGIVPAPLVPQHPGCLKIGREFIPTNITEVPHSSINSLPAPARNRVLLRINMAPCACGCLQSIAGCRTANPQCPTSQKLIEREIETGPTPHP